MALWVPLIFGSWSDTVRTRIGGRLPFVLGGGIPAAGVLALIGFVHGLGLISLVASLFFFFYFVAYEPYRAMYPDMLPSTVSGRAQSAQAVARGLGTGCALLGGGLLLTIARPLPFAVAAVLMMLALGGFVVLLLVRRGGLVQGRRSPERPAQVARRLPRLLHQPALRAYFFANALWEMALSALKAFIVLYLTLGLGYSLSTASLLIGGVAMMILIGAAGSGKLADRFGRVHVVAVALVGYGTGYLVLTFTTSRPVIGAAIPFVALGGGTVMTMAYALLMPLMPADEHGALTGFYSTSRGVGIVLGPVIAGALIWGTRHGLFAATQGFQAMWIVCAAATFASLFFLRRLACAKEDQERREDNASGG
jgi:Na+/melibiose symporter-like transporter